MAISDKKLVQKAKLRYERLKKLGLQTDALERLKNQLNVFYGKNKSKRTSISGISIKKSMNVQERKEMRLILRSFLKSPDSDVNSIKREYERKFGQYKKSMQRLKSHHETDVKKMSTELQKLNRILEDRRSLSYIGSEVTQKIWKYQQEKNYSTDIIREVLREYVNEQIENERQMTTEEMTQEIIDRIRERTDAYAEIF